MLKHLRMTTESNPSQSKAAESRSLEREQQKRQATGLWQVLKAGAGRVDLEKEAVTPQGRNKFPTKQVGEAFLGTDALSNSGCWWSVSECLLLAGLRSGLPFLEHPGAA